MKFNDRFLFGLCALWLAVPFGAFAQREESAVQEPAAMDSDDIQGNAKEVIDADESEDKTPTPALQKGFAGNYLSARFARSSGNVKEAIRYLRKAHMRDTQNIDLASQLQGMLLLDGQVAEAVSIARQVRASDRKDALTDLLLTLQAIKEGHAQEASGILDEAFTTGSGQLWQPLIAGWLDADQKKLTKPLAIEDLSASVGRATLLVNYHLALINHQAGFIEEAANNFRNAVEDVSNPPSRIMESLLSFYQKYDEPPVLTQLVASFRAVNPDTKLHGDIPLPSTVQQGVAEVLLTMGSVMMEADVTQDAMIYLRMALYLRPDLDVAMLTLGDAYSNINQYQHANEIYGAIAKTSRLYSSAQLHIAINLDRMGSLQEAIDHLNKMSRQLPDQYDMLVIKGDLLRTRGDFASAVAAYSGAIGRIATPSVRDWTVFFARGASYERLGKWALAEQDMIKALALNPDQPEVLNFLGYSWLTRGERIGDARMMLEKALRARPNDPQIIDSLGWALYLQGQYQDASKYLEKAVQLMPQNATINDHLGDVYWRLGRKIEARFQWERALDATTEQAQEESLRGKLEIGLPPAVGVEDKSTPVVAASESKSATP